MAASRSLCFAILIMTFAGSSVALAQRVVDLGHSLAATDPSWTGDRVFQRKAEPGQGYVGGTFSSDEHFGTHLDAPAHFGGAWTVDRIPPDRLVRPGICVKVTGKPEDYQLTVADLKAFEAKSGAIPEGSIVLIATGWDARWPDQKNYMNERNGVKHFPGIHPDAAAYLARDRKVAGIGIDTPSVDYGPSATFETHNLTMPLNVFHIENAANLTSLPAAGFTVVVAPVKLAGGSGGPTRVFALLPASSADAAATTAIRFGKLWDGSRVITDAVVVVTGDRITSVGSGNGSVPAGAEIVDLRNYFGLPGLIDLHTHITYYWDRKPGTRPRGTPRLPAVTVYLAQDNARRTLETGVTTIRDLNAGNDMDLAMRELIASGAMIGPRMFVSGPGLSSRPNQPLNAENVASLVGARVKSGVDWIKVFGSRGSYEVVDGTQTVTFDEMKSVVDAAHAAGKKVTIHSYGASGVRDAVRAGADSIEHGADVDDATFAEMAKKGIVWVPTVDHNRYYIDARDEFGFAPGVEGPLKDYIARNLESVRRAIKAGVKIGMGSDAVYTMFGQNTRELEWLVKAGMTPAQALGAATTTPAELLGMGDRLGRIAPGYFADLVAVDGDPTADIRTLFGGVNWVMKAGQVVVQQKH